jgi:hypothetical protein
MTAPDGHTCFMFNFSVKDDNVPVVSDAPEDSRRNNVKLQKSLIAKPFRG